MFSTKLGSSRKTIVVNLGLAVVLLLSLYLRLDGIDWDGLYHLHPDERYIVWVGTTVEWPADWRNALDPELSSFNPFYWPPEANSQGITVQRSEPRDFAYGHWPLYLGVGAAHLLAQGESWAAGLPAGWTLPRALLNADGLIEYHHLLLVGRAMAALFDTLTVWLVFLLGRKLFGPVAGLAAAALLGFSVLHIQSAHFFITDPFLTTAVVAAVACMAWRAGVPGRAGRGSLWATLGSGVLIGLAVGAKFSAIMLVAPLAVALVVGHKVPPVARGSAWHRYLKRAWIWLRRPLFEFGVALIVAFVAFALTNPFALLDNTCTARLGGITLPLIDVQIKSFTVHSCYLKNIGTQSAMVRGGTFIPFTYQYIGTPAFLYYLDQMARWGLGPLFTIAGFGGLLWATLRFLRRRTRPGVKVLLAWVWPFFLVTGSFEVKFLRYLLPLIPFLAILAAGMLADGLCRKGTVRSGRRIAWAALGALTLAGTMLWGGAFVSLYGQGDHPWVEASRWLYEYAPSGSTLAVEHWDHSLPIDLRSSDWEGAEPRYQSETLPWYNVEDLRREPEDRIPLDQVLQQVAESDYVILASNRLYGVIPKLAERFPEGAAYYRLLFEEQLGFELVHWSARMPQVAGVVVTDDPFNWPELARPGELADWDAAGPLLNLGPADESFTVYDHPLVLIFENRDRFAAEELETLIRAEAAE